MNPPQTREDMFVTQTPLLPTILALLVQGGLAIFSNLCLNLVAHGYNHELSPSNLKLNPAFHTFALTHGCAPLRQIIQVSWEGFIKIHCWMKYF